MQLSQNEGAILHIMWTFYIAGEEETGKMIIARLGCVLIYLNSVVTLRIV